MHNKGIVVVLYEDCQHQHGHESVVPVVHFLPGGEQTDVQSIQDGDGLRKQIADSPQSEENTDGQIHLRRPQIPSRTIDERLRVRTVERTMMKKLNQRGCRMSDPSSEMSFVFR